MSCFKPDDIVPNEYDVHPLADQMKEFESLSPWILVDGYCAMRHIKGDNPSRYGSRVAFIEKTARVHLGDDKWEPVNKSSDFGMSVNSLEECDKLLTKLGYK